MMKNLPRSLAFCGLLAGNSTQAAVLFEESFDNTTVGTNNFSGTANGLYEKVTNYAQDTESLDNVTNVVAGLDYGSIGNVGLTPSGNSVFNSTGTVANKWRIGAPLTIAEGSTVYFSALATGDRRAHFGPFDYTGGYVAGDTTTSNWDKALAVGFNTQQITVGGSGIDPNSAGSLDAAWYPGPGDPLGSGFQDGGAASVPGGGTATRFLVGRIVNNPGAGNDIIEFHSVFVNSTIALPETFTSGDLDGAAGDALFYTKTDYDFGGDLDFADMNFTLQNNSGIDEVRFGETYFDVTGAVPEPGIALLGSLGLLGLLRRRR